MSFAVVERQHRLHRLERQRIILRKPLRPFRAVGNQVIRPDVVLFNEMLPRSALSRYQVELDKGFDLVVSIGTSSVFPYITAPIQQAVREGVPTVEINPGESSISSLVDVHLPLEAAKALEDIAERMTSEPQL